MTKDTRPRDTRHADVASLIVELAGNDGLVFESDASHGYLHVPIAILAHLNLRIGDFSSYSFTDFHKVYLEEDCDASKFLNAWEKFCDVDMHQYVREIHTNGDAECRSYQRIKEGK